MTRTLRRLAVSSLAAAIAASTVTSTQAGLIPFIYDTIFGPHHRGPVCGTPYQVGYGRCAPTFCQPVRCNPCRITCPPQNACRTSTPTTVAFYHPFYGPVVARTNCDAKTSWKSNGQDEAEQAPAPKTTFAENGKDPFNGAEETTPMEVNRPRTPVIPAGAEQAEGQEREAVQADAEKAAGNEPDGSAAEAGTKGSEGAASETGKKGFVPTENAKASEGGEESKADSEGTASGNEAAASDGAEASEGSGTPAKVFEKPDRGEDGAVDSASEQGEDGNEDTGAQGEESAGNEAACLGLESVRTWNVSSKARRVPFRPGYGHVRVARQSHRMTDDYVLSPSTITRLAGR